MVNELGTAIQQIAEEKKLSVEAIKETIELALAAAFRKDFGNKTQNIKVDFDIETGASRVFDSKTVVEDALEEEYQRELEEKALRNEEGGVEDIKPEPEARPSEETEEEDNKEEEIRFNPKTMISLNAAKEIQKDVEVGEELIQELEVPQEYGRMAAQTAKQVIIQKIREAERENIYNTFKEKEHELVNGMVQRVEPRVVLVDIDKTTAVMPHKDQVESERYRIGSRMKFYIKEVNQTPKGPEIILSRNHPEILRKLFSIEVPEITSGTVVIKSIAREAGSRSKIAVASKEDNIDPIGACVGQRGARVQTIISELGGEKIDIIEHSDDIIDFISNSLSPAKVINVELDEAEHTAKAFVREDQLSLAIGKGGQNVRLAARLTGWRLDIVEENSGEIKMTSEDSDDEVENAPESDAPESKVTEDQASADKETETKDTAGQEKAEATETEETKPEAEAGAEEENEAEKPEQETEPEIEQK